jgi:hypothetical protein
MLTHLDHTLADGLHITQIAERSLAKPRDQPTLRRLVAQALEPRIERGQGLDDLHAGSVIVRLHFGKIALSDEGLQTPIDLEHATCTLRSHMGGHWTNVEARVSHFFCSAQDFRRSIRLSSLKAPFS